MYIPENTDLVYIVRDGENDELKYSLRSVNENLTYNHIWIYCNNPPKWLQNSRKLTIIPQTTNIKIGFNKKHDITHSNLKNATLNPDITENFIYFNDDFFIIEPVEIIPPISRGLLSTYMKYNKVDPHASLYKRSVEGNYRILSKQPTIDKAKIYSYEMHAPLPVTKQELNYSLNFIEENQRTFIMDLPLKRTIHGNLHQYHLQPGFNIQPDVKKHSEKSPYHGGQYFSTNEGSFNGAHKNFLNLLFNQIPEWEKY